MKSDRASIMVESDKWFYIYLQHKLDYMCMVKKKGQIDKKNIKRKEEDESSSEGGKSYFLLWEGWKIYQKFIEKNVIFSSLK